jgi:hypothetical protein
MPYIKFVHEGTAQDTSVQVEHKGHLSAARKLIDEWEKLLPDEPAPVEAAEEVTEAESTAPKAEAAPENPEPVE